MVEKTVSAVQIEQDDDYDAFQSLIRQRVEQVDGPVFETDALPDDVWRVWLESIPLNRRQHYNCHCCRHFIQKFGRLVTIDGEGNQDALLWDANNVPASFTVGVGEVEYLIKKAKVTGPFLWSDKERVWGTPVTGPWTHLSGTPKAKPFVSALRTPFQESADKKQDYQILSQGLAEYPEEVVAQAVRVLESESLYRSEKAVGVAKWLADLHDRLKGLKGRSRNNVVWLAVATAPAGFCHVRSTMISTLLDDVKAGLPFDTIARKWRDKMSPLQYQRPTAAPTVGAIEQAEKVFSAMGAEKALERRYATLDDVLEKVWLPVREESRKGDGGLFSHLRTDTQPVRELDLPTQPITFEKFRRDVLPGAKTIEVSVPFTGPFYGLVTAVHPDAPPILQWDGLDGSPRNPVSWYFYHSGSTASRWGLRSSEWTEVTALFLAPHQWHRPEQFGHQGLSAFFALNGCRDETGNKNNLCLFPETLRKEFHPVRSVIEAHSKSRTLVGAENANANGIAFQKGSTFHVTVRVSGAGGRATYRIDRWD